MTEKQHLKSLGIILFFIGALYVMHKYSSKTKGLKKGNNYVIISCSLQNHYIYNLEN